MHLLLCFFFVVETALLLELSYLWNSLRLGFPSCHFLHSCKPSWLSTSLLVCSVPEQGGAPPGGAGGRCVPEAWRAVSAREERCEGDPVWMGGRGGGTQHEAAAGMGHRHPWLLTRSVPSLLTRGVSVRSGSGGVRLWLSGVAARRR